MNSLLNWFESQKKGEQLFNIILLIVITALMVSYAAAFPFLIHNFGPAIRLFCVVFIFPACIFWGLKGGLAIGALTFLLNITLHYYTGYKFEGGLIGPLILVVAILTVGRLSDLRHQLNNRLCERNKAERELQLSEEKYRQLFEMESDGLALVDAETGRILEINNAAAEALLYSREELLQMNALDISAEPEKTLTSITEKRDKVPIRYLRKKDGTVFPAEGTMCHFEMQGRQVLNVAFRDISFRVEAEKEKRSFERLLQHSHRMEAIGTLAGGIAHDFNNILGAIIGYSELLKILKTTQDSKCQSHIEQILMAGYRAKELVQQILTFSRKNEISMKPFMVKPIVKEVLQLMRAAIPANIEIKQKISINEDTIIADPIQIHQVIMNLCTNASQAMYGTGGKLEVGLSNVHLDEIFVEMYPNMQSGHYIEISVSDTGYGIPPEIIDKIFDPYFTTKEKGHGTGLGLSVTHGIVNHCHGCITVESRAGKGSTFKVYLPVAQKNAENVNKDSIKFLKGTERILIVDDEPALLDMTVEMLEEMGYQVDSRTSSIEALELFKTRPTSFDLVITDMAMPNMTGTELSIKIVRINPKIPIIICTGYSQNLNKEKAKILGFKNLLMKPVSIQALSTAIREALDDVQIPISASGFRHLPTNTEKQNN